MYHANTSKKKSAMIPLISVKSKFQSKGYFQVKLWSSCNYKGISLSGGHSSFQSVSLNSRVSKYMEKKKGNYNENLIQL